MLHYEIEKNLISRLKGVIFTTETLKIINSVAVYYFYAAR